jgi:CDP-6-deoxy-D-xylo-4-hexulose-3-dehydrase
MAIMKPNLTIRYGGSVCNKEEEKVIIKAVKESIKTGGWQATEQARLMEEEAAKQIGTKYGLLTSSGSCAGLLALAALELPKGSEVIISACTFPTIFNIILQCGLVPVVVDAKVGTYTFDVKEVEKAVTKKTKAIIAIHPVGNPVDMQALMKVARKHNVKVIEDCSRLPHSMLHTSFQWAWEEEYSRAIKSLQRK